MGTVRKIIKKDGKASWEIDYYDPLGKRIRVRFQKKKEADDELSKRMALIAENRYLDVKKESRIFDFTTCGIHLQAT